MRASKMFKTIFLCSCVIIPTAVNAQFGGLGNALSNALGGDPTPGAVSADDLVSGYSQLQVNFIEVFRNLLTAQAITAKALGSQEDAERYAAQATELGSGECGANCMDATITVSQDAMAKSNELLSNADQLDEDSSNQLGGAVPYYLAGTVASVQLPGSFLSWADQAAGAVGDISSNPLAALSHMRLIADIPTVVRIAAAMPDVISTWLSTTGNFVDFANSNGIETGDLETAASQQF